MAEKKLVGKVAHYYGKIGVAVVKLSDTLCVGDKISIECSDKSVDVEQNVESMQVEHKQLDEATKGQSVGLKVDAEVHEGDNVYKVAEE